MSDLTLVPPPVDAPPADASAPTSTKKDDLALSPPPPPLSAKGVKLTSQRLYPRDLKIVALSKMGVSEEEIANRLRTDLVKVQASLLKWYRRQLSGSAELVQMRVNEMSLAQLDDVNHLMQLGLHAEKIITDDKGVEVGREPDLTVRRQFANQLKEWIQAVQPKSPLINQTLNQNNQTNVIGGGGSRSFEARLRERREARGLLNNPDTVEGEVVEEEEEDEKDEKDEEDDSFGEEVEDEVDEDEVDGDEVDGDEEIKEV